MEKCECLVVKAWQLDTGKGRVERYECGVYVSGSPTGDDDDEGQVQSRAEVVGGQVRAWKLYSECDDILKIRVLSRVM